MSTIIAFGRLIRLPNLLMIALVQYLVRYFIIIPKVANAIQPKILEILRSTVYGAEGVPLSDTDIIDIAYNKATDFLLSDLNFFLLSLSTIMITAAGYIINDYFDVKTDSVNKPNSIIIDTYIKRRVAMGAHLVLGFMGILLGFYLGWVVGNWQLGSIHAFAFIFLWFYSTNYKKQLLIGNLLVSMLTALVIAIIGIYERGIYTTILIEYNANAFVRDVMMILLTYAGFAFIISMMREIVKDMEDMQGDKETGATTLPIQFGLKITKVIAIILTVVFMALVGYAMYSQWLKLSWIHLSYVLVFIIAPGLMAMKWLISAEKRKDYHVVSILIKVIMLAGVLSIPVLYHF